MLIIQHKIQPWKLYLLVATLVAVEVIYLSIWTLVDPLRRVEELFPPEIPENTDEDVRIRPILEHCESHHNNIWLGMWPINNELIIHLLPIPQT